MELTCNLRETNKRCYLKESSIGSSSLVKELFVKLLAIYIIVNLINVISGGGLVFAESEILTDLFDTEGFRGSFVWLDKFNFIGGALNFLISAFCFIGLFSILLSKILTVTYFSIRPFWDTVHTIKQENMNQKFAGVGGYLSAAYNGKHGSGIDSIVSLFFIFLPDIKEYSEMGSNRDSKLTDEDSVVTWFLKTGFNTVMIGLALAMGFNGSLMKCYGVFIDGLGAVTTEFANVEMGPIVTNILNTGENYDWSIGSTGLEFDKLQLNMAKAINRKVLSTLPSDNKGTGVKLKVGAAVEKYTRSTLTKSYITELSVANGSQVTEPTDKDFGNTKFSVDMNSNSSSGSGTVTISVADLVGAEMVGESKYIHLTPIISRKAPEHNYLDIKR